MNNAIIMPEATISAKAFGEEAPAKKRSIFDKSTWTVTYVPFEVPVEVRAKLSAKGDSVVFFADTDDGTLSINLPDALAHLRDTFNSTKSKWLRGTLTIGVPKGRDISVVSSKDSDLLNLNCKPQFVSFEPPVDCPVA